MKRKINRQGFMLLEVVVVMAIIAALVSIAVPRYASYLEKARAAACLANRETINKKIIVHMVAGNNPPESLSDIGYPKSLCPSGGVYVLVPAGKGREVPTVACSLHHWPEEVTPPPPIPGLVAAWNMDEGQGNTVGAGQTIGTVHDAQWINDPQRGTALNLDGKNDYVSIPGDGVLKMPYEQITYSAWFKSGEDFTDGIAPPGQKLIAKNSNFHLSLGPSGDGLLPGADMYLDGKYVSTGGAYAAGKGYTDLVIKDNDWHNLAATYDGATMKLYKDGELILAKTGLSGTVGSAGTSNSKLPVYLGAENGTSRFVNGSMDKAYIFNRALTDKEIHALTTEK